MKKNSNNLLKITIVSVVCIILIVVICDILKGNDIKSLTGRFSTMAKSYEEYYDIVEVNIKEYESEFNVTIKKYNENEDYENVINEVIDNNQELGGVCLGYNYSIERFGNTANIYFDVNYSHSKEELLSRDKELKSKVKQIVKNTIKSNMKDYEKEKVLHDYIVKNCEYDERYYTDTIPMESYTAYGVLIKGIGVCQGYAVAMNMLLEEAGIESIIITGEVFDYNTSKYDGHAWNLVKLDDEYYHLDSTWDDPVGSNENDRIIYSYFNLNDNQMKNDHKWDENKYPRCISTKYNFDNLNIIEKDNNGKVIIAVSSINELYSYLRADISAVTSEVTYKVKNFNSNTEEIKKIVESVYESLLKSGRYSFSCEVNENNSGYITFYFE